MPFKCGEIALNSMKRQKCQTCERVSNFECSRIINNYWRGNFHSGGHINLVPKEQSPAVEHIKEAFLWLHTFGVRDKTTRVI